MLTESCPLCDGTAASACYRDAWRVYWYCPACDLVFVPREFHLDKVEEQAEYLLHENSADDKGYVQFLQRIIAPVTEGVPDGARCLDFGSGPVPVLAGMLHAHGFQAAVYDKYFAADPTPLHNSYAFITATEVVEHLAQPGRVLRQLTSLLKQDGRLGIMTKRRNTGPPDATFANWHYIRDRTHIAFFSDQSFLWLAGTLAMTCTFPTKDIVILQK